MMLPSRRPKLSSSEAPESGTSVGSDHGEDDKGGAGIARNRTEGAGRVGGEAAGGAGLGSSAEQGTKKKDADEEEE